MQVARTNTQQPRNSPGTNKSRSKIQRVKEKQARTDFQAKSQLKLTKEEPGVTGQHPLPETRQDRSK
jgi:hypothetical protein